MWGGSFFPILFPLTNSKVGRTRHWHGLHAAAGELLGAVRVGDRGGKPEVFDEVEALDGVPAQATRVPGGVTV